ncbi:MAG: nuclear transport factor 2 family protein [Acidobacteria bacterium]|nr:nuclear transport factor 2 family protein [Acidobacteriota bacterium]
MRKVCVILVASLALAATCMGQTGPTSQPDSGRIKPPTATSTGGSATGDNKLEAMLIAREKEVWGLIKKKDAVGFAAYLAEDQLYVNSQGVHSKAESVKGIGAEGPSDLTLDDWKVIMIDKDAAIVTYRATPKAEACGPEPVAERNTTVWVKRGGKWLAVFHQDTTVASGK